MDINIDTALAIFAVGALVCCVGFVIPVETTETTYINGQVIEETNENTFVVPMRVVGAVLAGLGGTMFKLADPPSDEADSESSATE